MPILWLKLIYFLPSILGYPSNLFLPHQNLNLPFFFFFFLVGHANFLALLIDYLLFL